jgi:hypothetical protein
MNDEATPLSRAATMGNTAYESRSTPEVTCVVCRANASTTSRRTISYLGTWNTPEAVCGSCAAQLDRQWDQLDRAALEVDRVVHKFRGRFVA